MLGIHQSTSADAAKSYFVAGLSQQDYYTGQEVVGQWHGEGARRLGLSGSVTKEAFHALCDNRHPQTGQQLTARMQEGRRVGYDFTFSAPKSVSLLYGLTGDARLKVAMEQAVAETMREVEADIQTRVRRGGVSEDRRTGNLVWAAFPHEMARPVGGVPDPQLHVHAFAFNATHDPVEQRWKAAEFGDIKSHAGYYEAAFHARLAGSMRDLGFDIRAQQGKWWDLAALSPETVALFSRRTAQVTEEAQRLGITDASAKAELGHKTRERKQGGDLATDTIRAEWWDRLTPAARREVEAAIATLQGEDSAATPRSREQVVEERVAAVDASLAYASAHCFERASTVHEKELLAEALRHGQGRVLPEHLRRGMQHGDQGILTAQVGGQRLVTTRQVLAEERRLLAWAHASQGAAAPLGAGPERFHSAQLNAGQQTAVQYLLDTPDRLLLIQGKAGTGKTTLMQEAAQAITAHSGKKVMTVAPTTRARDVLRQDGFAQAQTVAWLLTNTRTQQGLQDGVLWVDEAGLLSVPELNKVFALADQTHCRLILSGDTGQHGAVARGDAMRLLHDQAGIEAAELTGILRQQGAYKEAVTTIERGQMAEGFAQLDTMGWVVEVPDAERYQRLAADYARHTRAGETAIIVSPTHAEGRQVATAVRDTLRQEGRLGSQEQEMHTLRNLQWTTAQKSHARQYSPGLVVQFLQHAPGIGSGQRFTVVDADDHRVLLQKPDAPPDGQPRPLPLGHADRFQVYTPEPLTLAQGDRVRITQKGRSVEGRTLTGGACYQVAGFAHDQAGHLTGVRLENGATLAPDFGHVAQGYVTTSHGAQGATADQVLLAEGAASLPAASREQFYVSVSRGRKGATVYTDDKEALASRIERTSHRLSATEMFAGEVGPHGKPLSTQARQQRKKGYDIHQTVCRQVEARQLREAAPAVEGTTTTPAAALTPAETPRVPSTPAPSSRAGAITASDKPLAPTPPRVVGKTLLIERLAQQERRPQHGPDTGL